MSEKITISVEEYNALKKENSEYKADIAQLRKVTFGILGVFGFVDENGYVDPAKFGPDADVTGNIMKGLGDTVTLLAKSKSFGPFKRKAEAEIAEKFGFLKIMPELIKKHAQNG